MQKIETISAVDDQALAHAAFGFACAFSDPDTGGASRAALRAAAAFPAAFAACAALAGDGGADRARGERGAGDADAGAVAEWLELDAARRSATFHRVFGMVAGKDCPPLETEYLPWKDATHRAQHKADAAGFYRAFGLCVDPRSPAHPDHVAIELEFVAQLHRRRAQLLRDPASGGDSRRALVEDALGKFLAEHVSWWLPTFAERVRRSALRAEGRLQTSAERGDVALLRAAAVGLAAWSGMERRLAGVSRTDREVEPSATEEEVDCSSCGAP